MLETLLDSAAGGSLSGRLRRIPVRDGVRAWDFDCALSLPSSLPAAEECRPNACGMDGPVMSASRIAVL